MDREEFLYKELKDIARLTHGTKLSAMEIALQARAAIERYEEWKAREESRWTGNESKR